MGLYHSVAVAYGFEIPDTDFDLLDQTLAEQPGTDRVGKLYLGDFEHLFLFTECERVEENTAAVIAPTAYSRYEIPAWNKALHAVAVRLGHEQHPLPTWLVLHDHS
jgi:hypothetical protein